MEKIRKYIAIVLFTVIIIMNMKINFSIAAQFRNEDSNNIYNIDESKYPGYATLLQNLKNQHPNWKFILLYTGLDWNYVIKSEYTGHGTSPKSLIQGKSGEWICSICGTKVYDNGTWNCASEAAIAYQMDPRNFLDDTNVFQFERYVYVEGAQNRSGVERLTSGSFVSGSNYTDAFMEAARISGVSPYFLASRLLQEQGSGGSTTGKGMTDSDGNTYYNMFNIGAYPTANATIIQNALAYAKSQGWNTPEKSIIGGAQFVYNNYLQQGLDTVYLQKFDIDGSDGTLFSNQYMQNIQAPETEGRRVASTYRNEGTLDYGFTFVIPMYENMPQGPCPIPSANKVCTKNAVITGDEVRIRDAGSLSGNIIRTVNRNESVLVIEEAVSTTDGLYWDKVVLSDGTIGYVANKYLQTVADVTNCNEKVYATTIANLRNGPGLTGTTVITTLTIGQAMTRIQIGMYNKDGYSWDRVMLADGRQGYVATNYISVNNSGGEEIRINADGLNVRNGPGTNYNVIRTLSDGTIVTRIEKAQAKDANGYYWDRIVMPDGLEGYASRYSPDGNKLYLVPTNETPEPEPPEEENNDFRVDDENQILEVEPKATIQNIQAKEEYKNATATNEKLATGSTVTIGDKTYTVIKLGDINGDGYIDSGDTFVMKQVIKEVKNFENDNYKKAADINFDEYIDSGDSFLLKKEVMEIQSIYLNK